MGAPNVENKGYPYHYYCDRGPSGYRALLFEFIRPGKTSDNRNKENKDTDLRENNVSSWGTKERLS